jgi:hypothetical protein
VPVAGATSKSSEKAGGAGGCGAGIAAGIAAAIRADAAVGSAGAAEGCGAGIATGIAAAIRADDVVGSAGAATGAAGESVFFPVLFGWDFVSPTRLFPTCFSESELSASDTCKISAKLPTRLDEPLVTDARAVRGGSEEAVGVSVEVAIVLDTSTLVPFRSRTPKSTCGTRLPQ